MATLVSPLELQESLNEGVSPLIPQFLRRAVVNRIFQVALDDKELSSLDAYFSDWFGEQCEVAVGKILVQKFQDIIHIILLLQDNPRRDEVVHEVRRRYGDGEYLNATIDFGARLWLTVSIGTFPHSLTPGGDVNWKDGRLSDTLYTLWNEPQLLESPKLPRDFNAANLEKLAGINICWTSNLADHLRLRDDDTRVMMYHQISFLTLHAESSRYNVIWQMEN